jgi:hypothetical protein
MRSAALLTSIEPILASSCKLATMNHQCK